MVPLVFKTSVGLIKSRVGSIPIRLRHYYCLTKVLTMNRQFVISCSLILVGIFLFIYGVFFHTTSVLPQKDNGSVVLRQSESAIIRDAIVGGLRLDEAGRIKRTYTGKPPQACPT